MKPNPKAPPITRMLATGLALAMLLGCSSTASTQRGDDAPGEGFPETAVQEDPEELLAARCGPGFQVSEDGRCEPTMSYKEAVAQCDGGDEEVCGWLESYRLSKSDVAGVIRRSFGDIRTCARASEVKGKLTVTFFVLPNGSVDIVEVGTGHFVGSGVARCVRGVVAQLQFPRHFGPPVEVSYPFAVN